MITRCCTPLVALLLVAVALPATAYAQSTFTVTERDELPDIIVDAGSADVVVGGWDVTASGGDIQVTGFEFTASGTGHDVDHLKGIRLVQDLNQNNVPEAGEPALGSGNYNADDGIFEVTIDQDLLLLDGNTWRLLLVYDILDAATAGSTFLSQMTGARTDAGSTAGIPAGSRTVTISGGGGIVIECDNTNMPGNQSVAPGVTWQVVAVWGMTARGTDIPFSSVTIDASGTGLDDSHLTTVYFVEDVNFNGVYDDFGFVVDFVLDSDTYSADNGQLTFTPPAGSFTMLQDQRYQFFIMVDIASVVPNGATFVTTISDVTSTIRAATVSGLPIVSNTTTINNPADPTLTFDNTGMPADHDVTQNTQDEVWGVFGATASNGDVTLETLTLAASGSGNDSSEITEVRLVHDVDGDGTVSAGDVELGAGTFSADNGTIVFDCDAVTASPLVVTDTTRIQLLVVVDFVTLVNSGNTYGLTVSTATASAASTPGVAGLPITGTVITVVDGGGGGSSGVGTGSGCAAGSSSLALPWLVILLLGPLVVIRRRA